MIIYIYIYMYIYMYIYIYKGFGDFGLGLFFRIYGNWAPFATSTSLNLGLSRGW